MSANLIKQRSSTCSGELLKQISDCGIRSARRPECLDAALHNTTRISNLLRLLYTMNNSINLDSSHYDPYVLTVRCSLWPSCLLENIRPWNFG